MDRLLKEIRDLKESGDTETLDVIRRTMKSIENGGKENSPVVFLDKLNKVKKELK